MIALQAQQGQDFQTEVERQNQRAQDADDLQRQRGGTEPFVGRQRLGLHRDSIIGNGRTGATR